MTVGVAESSSSEANALADRLIQEMRQAWESGNRRVTEDYLTEHPALAQHPGAAAELIYEEVSLRRAHGLRGGSSEVLRRFPHWAVQLRVFLELREALDAETEPDYPAIGERIGEFELLSELGRGRRGRVFLARQSALANRLMVLKLTPRLDTEHATLARLQHTHIVPLYSASDDAARGLRILCMPYFGGDTLSSALDAISHVPPIDRTVAHHWSAVQPKAEPVPATWLQFDYVRLIVHFGACLAQALQFAHDRQLVHMDVKPSNILLTADGEPMLLDFHLARSPLPAGSPAPSWLGGTPAYCSPEQRAAIQSVVQGNSISAAVDGRSDVYSLGVVLYEALGGKLPGVDRAPLCRLNRRVSRGLSDIVDRCLNADLHKRYQSAAALAIDLHRHLTDLPLCGVRNRSWRERWRKWRQRRPHALGIASALTVLIAAVALAAGYAEHRRGLAREALDEGRTELAQGHFAEARGAFRRGLALADDLPIRRGLVDELRAGLGDAERAAFGDELHAVAEGMRAISVADDLPPAEAARAIGLGGQIWERRSEIFALGSADLPEAVRDRARSDIFDIVFIWSRLRVASVSEVRRTTEIHEVLEQLDKLERELGQCPGLYLERATYCQRLGSSERVDAYLRRAEAMQPISSWDHVLVGDHYLRGGEPAKARAQFVLAVARDPKSFWARLQLGRCDLLAARADDALISFAVCIGIDANNPVGHLHKALAHARLGQRELALADIDRVLQIDPSNAQAISLREQINKLP